MRVILAINRSNNVTGGVFGALEGILYDPLYMYIEYDTEDHGFYREWTKREDEWGHHDPMRGEWVPDHFGPVMEIVEIGKPPVTERVVNLEVRTAEDIRKERLAKIKEKRGL